MTKHDEMRYNMVMGILKQNNRQDLIDKFNAELNKGKDMDLILADLCFRWKLK